MAQNVGGSDNEGELKAFHGHPVHMVGQSYNKQSHMVSASAASNHSAKPSDRFRIRPASPSMRDVPSQGSSGRQLSEDTAAASSPCEQADAPLRAGLRQLPGLRVRL